MAKPDKKNKKKKKAPEDPERRGLLIALDGASGSLLRSEAQRLAGFFRRDHDPAWSLFDASNTFYEMRLAKVKNLTPTPRTLLLLYASDLLFRLRWEIEPTIREGRNVVAAPYVESAMAFGLAAGIPRDWLEELFRFAPKPAAVYRLKEKKKPREKIRESPVPGFVEFCCATLGKQYAGWEISEVRAAILQYLKDLEEREQLHEFGKKPHQMKRALT